MSENRLWILLARKFKQEISEAEAMELEELLLVHKNELGLQEWLTDPEAIQIQSTHEETETREMSWHTIQEAMGKEASAEGELIGGEKIGGERFGRLSIGKEGIGGERDEQNTSRQGRFGRNIFIGIAASLVLVVSTYVFFRGKSVLMQLSATGQIQESSSNQYVQVIASKATKTAFVLPDGSSVVLNRSSKLAYNKNYGEQTREIRLSGEAYFEVQKNKNMPLIIHAGNMDIKVLGTVFNVRTSRDDSVSEAILVSGAIEISSPVEPGKKILLHPGEKFRMNPLTQKGIGATTGVLADGQITPAAGKVAATVPLADSVIMETEWIGESMSFHSQSFEQLAERMERWYNVEIHLEGNSLKRKQFTGSFEQESLEEALKALTGITPFHYRIVNRSVFIDN